MSQGLVLRDFRVEDYPEVESLWDVTGLLSMFDNKGLYERKTTVYPDLFVVAENEGVIVGSVYGFNPYLPFTFSGLDVGYVGHLAVHPSQQCKGLGSMLLDEICERLAVHGKKYVILFAVSRRGKGEDLRRFYSERHGFNSFMGIYYKKL